jgi:signal transduction histidine kinase
MKGMVSDWLARVVTARHAPAVGVAVLATAALGQVLTQFVMTDGQHRTGGAVQTVFGPAPVCLLALAATVPLLFLRPAAAAITIAAANALLLAGFGEATVAGVLAQLIAAYRVGAAEPQLARERPWEDWLRRVPGARRANVGARAGAQYLGIVLAVPFLVLALAGRGGAAAVLLAWGGPAAGCAGIAVRARREARTRTAAGEALADTMLAHTARGERARIARELHDVVAHHISMVAVQAETARLTTPGLPAAGAHRFAEIGDTARAGLTEMRRLLGVLREDAEDAGAIVADRHPLPGLPQLAGLVDAARDASGAGIRLIVSGPVTEFDPGVELAAYRIVQEALTNARRHAPSAAVDVELRYADDALRLRVRDNGPGPAGSPDSGAHGPRETPTVEDYVQAGAGHGLLGMRERTLAVGGTLWTGPAPGGGFLVEAVLPAKPEVAGLRGHSAPSSRAEAAP